MTGLALGLRGDAMLCLPPERMARGMHGASSDTASSADDSVQGAVSQRKRFIAL